ncbi:pentapeptide repeat-containing protein [Pseudomonas solani]|uniref:pentapeptide repeat-containing protein n=1 Tax=Pseudomonas solani TaxID=2731552 RepID=UPI0035BE5A79
MALSDKPCREIYSKSFTLLKEENFDSSYLESIGASGKNSKVEMCSFRSATLVQCYFKGVVFVNCNFTATKFIDCNLKDARFIGCIFSYSTFRRTIVESSEIISNLPREPNIQRDLLRSLRVDARELGNSEDESFYIRKEISASEEFHLAAFLGRDSFYRQKYGKLERFGFLLQWISSKSSGLIWGNGERPGRIAGFCLFLVLAMTLCTLGYNGNPQELFTSGNALPVISDALKLSTAEFLGIPYKPEDFKLKIPFLLSVIAVSLRYLIIGLLVSVFFRVFSRR